MAISVSNWVWDHSRSRNGARLVLLAIADCARENGVAWPSVAELRRKTGLGDRAVQAAIIELAKLCELEVGYQQGPKGCNRYRLLMPSYPADIAGAQKLRGAETAGAQKMRGSKSSQVSGQDPADTAPPAESAPPQNSTPAPAESAGGTVKEPSKNSSTKSSISATPATGSLFGDDPAVAEVKPKRWTATTIKPLFAAWYAIYPVHKERADAEKAYLRVVNDGVDPAVLESAARSYCTDLKVLAGYAKNPATWLNKGCWTDDPTPDIAAGAAQNGTPGGKTTNYSDERHQRGFHRSSGS